MDFLRTKKTTLSLDMAPLIDIVFQLLIFFMLSSSFLAPSMKLNLPKAVTNDPVRDHSQIILSLDAGGNLLLNSRAVPLSSLEEQLAAKFKSSPSRAVFIRGDEKMPYKFFVQVMDAARASGAQQINIMHTPASAAPSRKG